LFRRRQAIVDDPAVLVGSLVESPHGIHLMARPFNAANFDFSGDPMTVVENALYEPMYSNAAFSASATGTLLYMAGNASNDL
jgi:hypothetical protein